MIQNLVNAILATAALVPMAIDTFLVYRLFRFFPFTSAAMFGLAPYLVLFFSAGKGSLPGLVATLAAVLAFALIGGLFFIERGPRRKGSPLHLFLLSLGLLVAIQNAVALAYGSQPTPLSLFPVASIQLGAGAVLSPVRIAVLVWSLLCLAVILILQRFTRLGLEWRALADDTELAEIVGLRPRRALLWAFCLGAVFTAGAGILQAADTAMTPHMGLRAFMVAVVAVVVGGQSLAGVLGAAILISWVQSFSVVLFGGRWQDAIVFTILLIFLFWRPHGLAATSERARTV